MGSWESFLYKFWTNDWNGYIIADKVGILKAHWADFNQCINDFRVDNEWNINSQFAIAFPEICTDIVATKIADISRDQLVWTLHKSGNVTSKAVYDFCRLAFPEVNWGSWIWVPFIPPIRSTLVWRLIWSMVPTSEVLNPGKFQELLLFVLCPRFTINGSFVQLMSICKDGHQ